MRGRSVALALVAGVGVALVARPLVRAQTPVSINVDAAANRRPIDPRIYGVNFASPQQLQALNVPLNRWGGNPTTRYNWQLNADNRGADWYFQSIASGDATPAGAIDSFVSDTRAGGAQPMLTIPTIGWVARLGTNRGKLASYSQSKYGAQTGNDWQWFPDAGNGVLAATGENITWNDPNDASVLVDSAFQRGLVEHMVARWGSASSGGVRYYLLDNEPSIWFATHRDVHNVGPTMDEILDTFLDYGASIKAADPGALVVGPEEWGWAAYFYSGFDQQYGAEHGWSFLPDRADHGGWDYLPWLLDRVRAHQQSTGQRLLDVFTVHYYPQGGEFSDDTSAAMQLRRNRSTRSLWDPNYVDETWINDRVRLVPRLRGWVNAYLPNTLIGITEYSWGAENHINGATTQADVLGIFGREGLDLATRWVVPATSSPTFKAFQMYRNYDGGRSQFGDVSVAASGPNPDQTAAFAAQRTSDGALTIMVVNKILTGTTAATINLGNFAPLGSAQVFRLGAANRIDRLADVSFSGNTFQVTLPAQTVTLFVLPRSSGTVVADVLWSSDNLAQLWRLNGTSFGGMTGLGGPGPGWRATSYFRNGDGSHQILWTTDNRAHVWRLNADGSWGGSVGLGGPGPGWRAASYFRNGDGSYHVLWTADNAAQVWTLNSNNTFNTAFGLAGPGAGWTATSYFKTSAGSHRVMWAADNLAQLWTITPTLGWGGMTGLAGPGAGWRATSYHLNGDGSWNVVWTSDNLAQIWSITAGGGFGGMMGLGGPGASWSVQSYFR